MTQSSAQPKGSSLRVRIPVHTSPYAIAKDNTGKRILLHGIWSFAPRLLFVFDLNMFQL